MGESRRQCLGCHKALALGAKSAILKDMILNTGQRTDIPAFFSDWLFRRVKEGYALARNPFFPQKVTRYRIAPDVVDVISFCTKNPAPMLNRLNLLKDFAQMWFVTITPYGRDIEPQVPPVREVIASFRALSALAGPAAVVWRYDPVLITQKYSERFHIEAFAEMAAALKGFTRVCVVSFIELYKKTARNFPQAKEVPIDIQRKLVFSFAARAERAGMRLKLCAASRELAECAADLSGCMTCRAVEEAVGFPLDVPAGQARARKACACLLGADIGAYNSCAHGCLYCYANADAAAVKRNIALHDPKSPFLIGSFLKGDVIREAGQKSWRSSALELEFGD